jgi:hypothetical protein
MRQHANALPLAYDSFVDYENDEREGVKRFFFVASGVVCGLMFVTFVLLLLVEPERRTIAGGFAPAAVSGLGCLFLISQLWRR